MRHRLGPILMLFCTSASAPAAGADVVRRQLVMGTRLEVRVAATTRAEAVRISEAAVTAVGSVEERLSTWSRDSELERVHRAPVGSWRDLTPELGRDLEAALWWWEATDGDFHPGLTPLVEEWGLRDGGREPSPGELADALRAVSLEGVDVRAGRVRRNHPGFGFEEGAFGKGVALRDALEAGAAEAGACLRLDLGGQVAVGRGCPPTEVRIAHPRDRRGAVATVTVPPGASVATSGNSERGITVDGHRLGHLLDPATGRPVPDWGSVTVISRDPVAADCVATALFVKGPREAADWLVGRDDVQAVLLVGDGPDIEVRATPGLAGELSTGPEVRVDWIGTADRRGATGRGRSGGAGEAASLNREPRETR